jgi:hypothetical protein
MCETKCVHILYVWGIEEQLTYLLPVQPGVAYAISPDIFSPLRLSLGFFSPEQKCRC